jgi:transcription-repair coupling factor (superfamily II helicase)
MESWLPWLSSDEHLLLDLLPSSALVAIIEPRRLRDRAQELLDEEAALAQTLATTWGKPVDEADTPRLSLPFERLLAHTKAQPVPVLAVPDSPETPVLAASAFDPVVGDADALA